MRGAMVALGAVALLAHVAIADDALVLAQAGGSPPLLPSLNLPPSTTTETPAFISLMQMGDSAMVRGDVTRARALYERAVSTQPTATRALIAAGKTYDPNMLAAFGNPAGLADPAKARVWYERARALGDADAAGLLASLR